MSAALALLLDMTLKASLLAVAGFALSGLARRRSAALRHDGWMAAIACCALLPAMPLALRLFPLAEPAAPVHAALLAITPHLPLEAPAGAIELIDRIWSASETSAGLDLLDTLVLAAWLLGAALALLRSCRSYRGAGAIVRRAAPLACEGAPVEVRVTAELAAPAVFGAWRPVILLPEAARTWPVERLRAVLAHEAAHVERRDLLLDLVVQFACAMHWYNPLVLGAARALRAERELACDAQVVARGLDPRRYAATLLQLARSGLGTPHPAMLAMARRPQLERRILAILKGRSGEPRGSVAKSSRAAAVGVAVALFVPLAALTTPSAGTLAPGSVQPGSGPLRGLDDPLSERLPLDYDALAAKAAAVPARGPAGEAIAALKAELDRRSHGYGDLVRERAVWALTQVEQGDLFGPVARHVADKDWRLRAYAAWGLAAAGDRRATALLIPMLDDPVWRVRAMAAAALAELADPAAADAVSDALDDPAWQVRISALDYIGGVGDAALKERARPLLRDLHGGTRTRAARVLAHS